jgi:hypothetical protein
LPSPSLWSSSYCTRELLGVEETRRVEVPTGEPVRGALLRAALTTKGWQESPDFGLLGPVFTGSRLAPLAHTWAVRCSTAAHRDFGRTSGGAPLAKETGAWCARDCGHEIRSDPQTVVLTKVRPSPSARDIARGELTRGSGHLEEGPAVVVEGVTQTFSMRFSDLARV